MHARPVCQKPINARGHTVTFDAGKLPQRVSLFDVKRADSPHVAAKFSQTLKKFSIGDCPAGKECAASH